MSNKPVTLSAVLQGFGVEPDARQAEMLEGIPCHAAQHRLHNCPPNFEALYTKLDCMAQLFSLAGTKNNAPDSPARFMQEQGKQCASAVRLALSSLKRHAEPTAQQERYCWSIIHSAIEDMQGHLLGRRHDAAGTPDERALLDMAYNLSEKARLDCAKHLKTITPKLEVIEGDAGEKLSPTHQLRTELPQQMIRVLEGHPMTLHRAVIDLFERKPDRPLRKVAKVAEDIPHQKFNEAIDRITTASSLIYMLREEITSARAPSGKSNRFADKENDVYFYRIYRTLDQLSNRAADTVAPIINKPNLSGAELKSARTALLTNRASLQTVFSEGTLSLHDSQCDQATLWHSMQHDMLQLIAQQRDALTYEHLGIPTRQEAKDAYDAYGENRAIIGEQLLALADLALSQAEQAMKVAGPAISRTPTPDDLFSGAARG